MAVDGTLDFPVNVAPALPGEHTTVRERLVPDACWRMDDVRFAFGRSFVNPDAADEFARLEAVFRDNPGALLALFGQADPTGDDEGNKVLSGRRAVAVFALLVRKPDLWERLFSKPVGKDRWGDEEIATMRGALARPIDAPAPATAPERAELFRAYMDLICRDLDGKSYTLDPATHFLGKGGDLINNRGAVQGCGEFNPVLVFSRAETAAHQASADPTIRDQENAPNRRVVGLLFPPTTEIDLARWPCPAATTGAAVCRKRFWSDHARRRGPGEARRTFSQSGDTFACRFFHRLAEDTPCAGNGAVVTMKLLLQQLPGVAGQGVGGVPFTLRVVGRTETAGQTAADGSIVIAFEEGTTTLLEIFGTTYHLQRGDAISPATSVLGMAERLGLLGYQPGPVTTDVTPGLDRAILLYQTDKGLDPDGDHVLTGTNVPNAHLSELLVKDLGS